MTKDYLKENYKEFMNCFDEESIIKKVDELNSSCETFFKMSNGIKTYDVNDVLDQLEEQSGYHSIRAYISIELHHVNGYLDHLEIPVDMTLEDWDEEEKDFGISSCSICDIEEW